MIDNIMPVSVAPRQSSSPTFSTSVKRLRSGAEHRNSLWAEPLRTLTYSYNPRQVRVLETEIAALLMEAQGAHKTFRSRDWTDYKVEDEEIATGDGNAYWFRLTKRYGTHTRRILFPDPEHFVVSVDGVSVGPEDYHLDEMNGVVILVDAPTIGAVVTWTGQFFIPVRFSEDTVDMLAMGQRLAATSEFMVQEVRSYEVIDESAYSTIRQGLDRDNVRFIVDAGTSALTGFQMTFSLSGALVLDAASGVTALLGSAATLARSEFIPFAAEPGATTLTGSDATLDLTVDAGVVMVAGFWSPDSQAEYYQPEFYPVGDWADPDAVVQWTTTLFDPEPDNQIEEVIATGRTVNVPGRGEVPTYTLNHRDGPDAIWVKFIAPTDSRTALLRFRASLDDRATWSDFNENTPPIQPAPRELPAMPTGFSTTPGAADGQIIMAVDAFTDYGDGVAGGLRMWTSATGEVPYAAGVWQLPASVQGSTIEVRVYAVDSQGFTGPMASDTVTVPGDAPIVTEQWEMEHFISQTAAGNPSLYRTDLSAHQIQHCHGGIRSKANPDDACFIMDVGGPWVTENAESDSPFYALARCAGLEAKNSVSGMWDPEIEGRYVHIGGERPTWPWTTPGSRTGIYVSENKGDNFTLVHNAFFGSEFYDFGTRSFRQVLNYAPSNYNIWYALSPKFGLHRSTTRANSWTQVNTNVGTMGQAWGVYVDATDPNKVRFAAENGLYETNNGGSSVYRIFPTGLPNGAVSHIEPHPTNGNEYLIVVYEVGIYRTTNNFASVTQVSTPTNFVSQVFQSAANPNYLWYMGINKQLNTAPSVGWGKSTGAFSSNNGASWTTCTTDGFTYGINRGTPDLMRAEGGADSPSNRSLQCIVLPSPLDADRAIGVWGHGLWRTNNGVAWKLESDGYSNHAGGDMNHGGMEWTPDNWILFAAFDKQAFISPPPAPSALRHWYQGSFASDETGAPAPVSFTVSKHRTKNKMAITKGFYNPNEGTVIISNDMGVSAGNSFRPAFFRNTYGSSDYQKWAHFHKTGRDSYVYSTTARSTDEGTNWTRWGDIDQSGIYWSQIGDPANADSRAGVRMCSPVNNDWLIAMPPFSGGMFLSKNAGLTWRKFTNSNVEIYGNDCPSLWMDPTDVNIIYFWRPGIGLVRYSEATQTETLCPGTAQYSSMRVQRVRTSYQNPNHIYFFNRQEGVEMVFRSKTGWNGTFENITANLPRQTGNQGFEIDPVTGRIWVNGVVGSRSFPAPA